MGIDPYIVVREIAAPGYSLGGALIQVKCNHNFPSFQDGVGLFLPEI